MKNIPLINAAFITCLSLSIPITSEKAIANANAEKEKCIEESGKIIYEQEKIIDNEFIHIYQTSKYGSIEREKMLIKFGDFIGNQLIGKTNYKCVIEFKKSVKTSTKGLDKLIEWAYWKYPSYNEKRPGNRSQRIGIINFFVTSILENEYRI
jgi:hypothetical protein